MIGSGVFPVIPCRKHQETCGLGGFVGDCCDGLKCERNFGSIGLPGKCVKGIFLVIHFCHSNVKFSHLGL